MEISPKECTLISIAWSCRNVDERLYNKCWKKLSKNGKLALKAYFRDKTEELKNKGDVAQM